MKTKSGIWLYVGMGCGPANHVYKSGIRHELTLGAGVRGLAVVGAACAFWLTACSTAGKPAAIPTATPRATPSAVAQPSSTVAPSTSAPRLPEHTHFTKPYLNAFEDFLVAYTRADEHADPASNELGQFSSGQALAWARKQVTDHARLGVAHRGEWHFRSVGAIGVTNSSAQVGQCMDWSAWPVVNRATGVTFQRFAPWSQLVYARMTLIGGQWKAATIRVQAAAC